MHLTIGRDCVLTVHENGEPPRAVDAADPFAILGAYRATVEFEQGLTAARLMKALRPWSSALSASAWMDFDAWLAAVEPGYVATAEAEDPEERLSGVELHPSVTFRHPGAGEGGGVATEKYWRLVGRFAVPKPRPGGGFDDLCSVSFCDPRLIGHLPITIADEATVEERRKRGAASVLAPASDGRPRTLSVRPTFFDAVVLGFLDELSFHGSPEATGEARAYVRQQAASLREFLDG